jgi:hypothetical protein
VARPPGQEPPCASTIQDLPPARRGSGAATDAAEVIHAIHDAPITIQCVWNFREQFLRACIANTEVFVHDARDNSKLMHSSTELQCRVNGLTGAAYDGDEGGDAERGRRGRLRRLLVITQ